MTKDELTADFAARVLCATKPPPIGKATSLYTGVLIVLQAFILIQVVPKFQQVFNDTGVELPAPTKLLFGLSNHYVTPVCTLILFAVILYLLNKRTLLVLFNAAMAFLFFFEAVALFMPHDVIFDKISK